MMVYEFSPFLRLRQSATEIKKSVVEKLRHSCFFFGLKKEFHIRNDAHRPPPHLNLNISTKQATEEVNPRGFGQIETS